MHYSYSQTLLYTPNIIPTLTPTTITHISNPNLSSLSTVFSSHDPLSHTHLYTTITHTTSIPLSSASLVPNILIYLSIIHIYNSLIHTSIHTSIHLLYLFPFTLYNALLILPDTPLHPQHHPYTYSYYYHTHLQLYPSSLSTIHTLVIH